MRDLLSWNLSLGRWRGVHVRLHVFFLLFAIVTLHFSLREDMLVYGATALGLLLVSVAAHELGHVVAARRIGGNAEQILLWPFGGLAHVNVSQEPQHELLTALAGPLVNAALCLLMAPVIVAATPDSALLLNPLAPPVPMSADSFGALDVLRLAFWINWVLMLLNLLPAFPLDGGRALRALLWDKFGFRTAVQLVARAAKTTAVLLFVVAWLVHEPYPHTPLPLAILGIFLYFAAKQETERLTDNDAGDPLFQYDFSQGYTSLEPSAPTRAPEPGPLRRWLDRRREERELRRQQIEQDEERRVDEVLARLHDQGRDALSPDDRALLDRVSARYRNRQRG